MNTTKYIFVTGGVVSSLGKGLAAASIGALLESHGYTVTLQKFDGLLQGRDMFDQVEAKLYKSLGIAFQRAADAFDATADNAVAGGKSALLKNARDCFQSALTLDKGAGVKKLIEALDRELKKASPEAQT